MEYINIINKIIEAEHSAREIADSARQRLDALPTEIKVEIADIHDDYMKRAERRIAMFAERERAYMNEQLKELDDKLRAELAEIDRNYAENADVWVDELFARVTGQGHA